MKIASVVGARPQFVKAAVVSRSIEKHNSSLTSPDKRIDELVIHTGQHYDDEMSRVFFQELDISAPKYNLGVGSGSHGEMTGRILAKIERMLLVEDPDFVIVYGDTNSTLAAALAAVKLHIPVAHVEAGLRSFNRKMPEEINRAVTDHISNLLFCPTQTAVANLTKEGITEGVILVGDVMYDAFLFYRGIAQEKSRILEALKVERGSYSLATVHRPENTDDPKRLQSIFEAFREMASAEFPIILPIHPRTRKVLAGNEEILLENPYLSLVSPVGYLDMLCLLVNARLVLTDSGGLQKEAYFAKVPCITLRDETEWVETVDVGLNVITGADKEKIVEEYQQIIDSGLKEFGSSDVFGRGTAGDELVKVLLAKGLP